MDVYRFLLYSSLMTIGASGLLIISGLFFIKTGHKDYHKKAMLSASFLALIFVVLYLIKSSQFPPQKYAGNYRLLYQFILWSHTFLSAANIPMAIITIYLALKEKLDIHKRIAPYTAAIWIYAAITGWLIRAFLQN